MDFKAFSKDESGVTAMEYGLMAAILAAAIVSAVPFVGTGIETLFKAVLGAFATANGS